jgi:Aspartate/tyrosine/aromatic aminotransferase
VTEAILQNFDDRSVPRKRNPGRSPDMVIEQRRQRLYKRQLEGLTTRHLVLEHSSREGVCVKTAWNDWKEVSKWNDEDWQKDRENMIARLQAMRVRLFDKAVKKGQFQTAAQILDSLGKVVGESVETVNINAPELAIRIENQKDS